MRAKSEKKRWTVVIDRDMRDRVQAIAERDKRTMTATLEILLESALSEAESRTA